jgi:hypothetical protein
VTELATTDQPLLDRVTALEGKVQELEAMVSLALRLLSIETPVSNLLKQFGATESEELAIDALLDDLSQRIDKGGMYRPSFPGFEGELYSRFTAVRGNRDFVRLLIDALKIDRPAYRKLYDFMKQERWPNWP